MVRIIIGVKGLWNKVENCWTTEEFSFNHVISSLYVQIRDVSTILCFSLIILLGVAGCYILKKINLHFKSFLLIGRGSAIQKRIFFLKNDLWQKEKLNVSSNSLVTFWKKNIVVSCNLWGRWTQVNTTKCFIFEEM